MTEDLERHLAAIMALDIAGYSRLMSADEAGTLTRLRRRRQTIFNPLVAEHRGRVVKGTGDGILAEFASAQDAIRAAQAIQAAISDSNGEIDLFRIFYLSKFHIFSSVPFRVFNRSTQNSFIAAAISASGIFRCWTTICDLPSPFG